MVAATSRMAYQNELFTGKFQSDYSKIFCAIQEKGGMSRREIAMVTGIELNSVCGRVNELVERRVLDDSKWMVCQYTKKTVKQVRIKPNASLA